MGDLLETTSRCPHCRASVRSGAPWCTLCHADLRPPPSPDPEPAVPAPLAGLPVPGLDPLTAPAAALGLPPRPGSEARWPCTSCGTANAIAADTCAGCGAAFLSGLRVSEGALLELPVVGDLSRMSRPQRLVLAAGVVLAVVALTALLSLLLD